METFEVRSKSFTIKWVKAPDNTFIRWELKPLKRSINLGIYRYNSQDELSEGSVSTQGASAQSAGAASASATSMGAVYGSENTSSSASSERRERERASGVNASASEDAAEPQAAQQLFSRENISVDAVNRVPRKLFSTIHKTFFSAVGDSENGAPGDAPAADGQAPESTGAVRTRARTYSRSRSRSLSMSVPAPGAADSNQKRTRHRAESRSSLISFNRASSLEERMDRHLTQEKWVGNCAGDEFISHTFKVERGGLFAFVFDNTFSRTKAKKVMFTQWVEGGEEPAQQSAQSAQVARQAAHMEQALRDALSERPERLHSHSSINRYTQGQYEDLYQLHENIQDDTLEEEDSFDESVCEQKAGGGAGKEDGGENGSAHVRFKLPEEKQLGKNTIMIRLKGVQYLQGILRKKRRRAGGNFVRRFFNLNFKYAVLDYYADEASNNIRGNMLVTQAVISADASQHMLYLDSGMEQWILKAVTKEDFDVWVQAFDYIKKRNCQQRLLKQHVGALQPQLGALQPQVGTLQPQVGTLQSQAGTLDPQMGTLDPQIRTLEPQMHTLQPQTRTLQPQMRMLQPPVVAIQPQSSAEQSVLSVPVESYGIGAIEDYIDLSAKQRASVGSDLENLQKLADTACGALGDLRSEIEGHWQRRKVEKKERKEMKEREMDAVQKAADVVAQFKSLVERMRGRFSAAADEGAEVDARMSSVSSAARRPLTRTTTAATSVLSQDFYDAQEVMEEMNEGVVMVDGEDDAANASVSASANARPGALHDAQSAQYAQQQQQAQPAQSAQSAFETSQLASTAAKIKYGSKENIFVSQLESEPASVSSSNETSEEDEEEEEEEVVEKAADAKSAVVAQLGGARDLYPLPYAGALEYRKDVPPCAAPPPSLIGILRKSLGKDLTGMTMPITSNEPISFMQKYAECFEYAALLNRAAADSAETGARMMDVACFAVSYLSSYRSKVRSQRKPFNPLLGETFEMVRPEMGMRLVCEKVVHHPVVFAARADGAKWQVDHCFAPQQKFYGKAAEMFVDGKVYLKLLGGERGEGGEQEIETYEWLQPTIAIKNVISLTGQRYSEPTAKMTIHSSTGYRAVIVFVPDQSRFSSHRSEKLTVKVYGPAGKKPLKSAKGTWTEAVRDEKSGETLWEVGDLVPDSDEKYGFTQFAAGLNQMTDIDRLCAPSDSRRRPDQRMYEDGKVDEAENLKLELEQKQRERRKKADGSMAEHETVFFKKSGPGQLDYTFVEGPQGYWERRKRQDWRGLLKLW